MQKQVKRQRHFQMATERRTPVYLGDRQIGILHVSATGELSYEWTTSWLVNPSPSPFESISPTQEGRIAGRGVDFCFDNFYLPTSDFNSKQFLAEVGLDASQLTAQTRRLLLFLRPYREYGIAFGAPCSSFHAIIGSTIKETLPKSCVACPICQTICDGHSGLVATHTPKSIVTFQPSFDFTVTTAKRDGLQPKATLYTRAGQPFLVKYDRTDYTFTALNEYLSLALADAAGLAVSDSYGVARLDVPAQTSAAFCLSYFNFETENVSNATTVLLSGLRLINQSSVFRRLIHQNGIDECSEEFDSIFSMCLKELTIYDFLAIIKEAGVVDLHELFLFLVVSEIISNFDNHPGNFGFYRNFQSQSLHFGPVYDLTNFRVYGETKLLLPASSQQLDYAASDWQKLARLCGVYDYRYVFQEAIGRIQEAFELQLEKIHATAWIEELTYPRNSTRRGPLTLESFLQAYEDSLDKSISYLQKQILVAAE